LPQRPQDSRRPAGAARSAGAHQVTGAELAEDVARRWRAMTALDALLDAVERGVPEAVRDAAAQPDLRDAMRLDLPSRLEALACLAVCGCPELAAEAFQVAVPNWATEGVSSMSA